MLWFTHKQCPSRSKAWNSHSKPWNDRSMVWNDYSKVWNDEVADYMYGVNFLVRYELKI